MQSLLALAFGDLELLGSDRVVRDNKTTELAGLSSRHWADLLSARYPDVVHPGLKYDIETALLAGQLDTLELLRVAEARWGLLGSNGASTDRFPLGLFTDPGAAPQRQLGFPVADSHLHSGASIPLSLFLQALATRRTPLSGPGGSEALKLLSATGREWDMTLLLCGCRWALRLLWFCDYAGGLNDFDGLDKEHFSVERLLQVNRGTFWTTVRRAATGSTQVGAEYISTINTTFNDWGSCPSLGSLVWRFRDSDALGERSRCRFLKGLVRGIVGIAALVTSRRAEGLSRFAERFQVMGAIKDAGLKEPELEGFQSRIIALALERVAPTEEVVGAEFRKTVSGGDFKSIRSDLSLIHI